MNNRISVIQHHLTSALNPTFLEILDESAQHIGHAGAQNGAGHYAIKISSQSFKPSSQIDNHRLIYQALGSLIPNEIHALRIQILFT